MSVLIYLDVCCLNRPFDDQTQGRIRLESEAVLLILGRCQRGEWELVSSEAIVLEINQTRDSTRRTQLQALASVATRQIAIDDLIEVRSSVFVQQGLGVFDALHLACAEAAQEMVFLTTDDRLLRWAKRQANMIQVNVANPVSWLWEIMTNANP